jgi:hypothetical protein
MHRHLSVALSTAAAVAALGLSACSSGDSKVASSEGSSATPAATPPNAASATAPLPAPEALTDVLSRLADPEVPGTNKVGLIEGATPASAATIDKFTSALRDNGYLPMTFTASNLAWSDKNPADAMATITVNTPRANNGVFTFPMEFTPFQGGWQLSKRTADMLLALSNSSTAPTPTPTPTPSPIPAPAPAPGPSPSPSAGPTETTTPSQSSSAAQSPTAPG